MSQGKDRIKLTVWSATNGAWRLITSRADALQTIGEWKDITGSFVHVKGRVNDADQNSISITWAKECITAIDVVEINQEY